MNDRVKKSLEDILIAIDEINIFFETQPKKYDVFVNSLLLRRGVERNIEIIGEAVSRILKIDNTISITNARKIVDTRNYIIHGYDTLTVDVLWSIVINHLPLLKNEVEELLKQNG
jgi:uncharacterized protein with HEPN domain